MTQEEIENRLEAGEMLARSIRSFLNSLPYTAPEALGFTARVKLAEPLAEYESVVADVEE